MKRGDRVLTDWNGRSVTSHIIQEVHDNGKDRPFEPCQSGILFRVLPALEGLNRWDWIDSKWFVLDGQG